MSQVIKLGLSKRFWKLSFFQTCLVAEEVGISPRRPPPGKRNWTKQELQAIVLEWARTTEGGREKLLDLCHRFDPYTDEKDEE